MSIYITFIYSDLKFPPQITNFDFIDIVRKMLIKKLDHRVKRFEEIKEHKYFDKHINWVYIRYLNRTLIL